MGSHQCEKMKPDSILPSTTCTYSKIHPRGKNISFSTSSECLEVGLNVFVVSQKF